jgi:hypothetical protein
MRFDVRPAILAPAILALAVLGAASCRTRPGVDDATAQTISDLGEVVNTLRQDDAILQTQIDSLRTVILKQDSTIRQLQNIQNAMANAINAGGVTAPPPVAPRRP